MNSINRNDDLPIILWRRDGSEKNTANLPLGPKDVKAKGKKKARKSDDTARRRGATPGSCRRQISARYICRQKCVEEG